MIQALARTASAISSEPPPDAVPRPRAIPRRVAGRPRARGPKLNRKRRRAGGSITDLTIVAGTPPMTNSVARRRPYQPPIRYRTPSDRKCAGCPVKVDASSSITCRLPRISTSQRCIGRCSSALPCLVLAVSVRLLARVHDACMAIPVTASPRSGLVTSVCRATSRLSRSAITMGPGLDALGAVGGVAWP